MIGQKVLERPEMMLTYKEPEKEESGGLQHKAGNRGERESQIRTLHFSVIMNEASAS